MAFTISDKIYGKGAGGSYGSISQASAEREKRVSEREKEARSLYDEIIKMYQPGGGFGQGTEAMLAREKQKYISQAQQGLVQSGLFGTTLTAGMPKKFEEEVAMPTRAKLEDLRYGALSQALTGKAGFIERIEDIPLDPGLIAELTAQAASTPQTVSTPFKSSLGADYSIYGSSLGGGKMGFGKTTEEAEAEKKAKAAGVSPTKKNKGQYGMVA